MAEPRQLVDGRAQLALAEQTLRSSKSVLHLEEGLALLQEAAALGAGAHERLARNIAKTYTDKIYATIGELVERDRNLPEPELEHLFQIILAFDEGGFELPAHARELKLRIARRLLDRYLEGHAAEEKRAALQQLLELASPPAEKKPKR